MRRVEEEKIRTENFEIAKRIAEVKNINVKSMVLSSLEEYKTIKARAKE